MNSPYAVQMASPLGAWLGRAAEAGSAWCMPHLYGPTMIARHAARPQPTAHRCSRWREICGAGPRTRSIPAPRPQAIGYQPLGGRFGGRDRPLGHPRQTRESLEVLWEIGPRKRPCMSGLANSWMVGDSDTMRVPTWPVMSAILTCNCTFRNRITKTSPSLTAIGYQPIRDRGPNFSERHRTNS